MSYRELVNRKLGRDIKINPFADHRLKLNKLKKENGKSKAKGRGGRLLGCCIGILVYRNNQLA